MWRKWHVFECKYKGCTVNRANHNGAPAVRKVANGQIGCREVISVAVVAVSTAISSTAIAINTTITSSVAIAAFEAFVETMYSRRSQAIRP